MEERDLKHLFRTRRVGLIATIQGNADRLLWTRSSMSHILPTRNTSHLQVADFIAYFLRRYAEIRERTFLNLGFR